MRIERRDFIRLAVGAAAVSGASCGWFRPRPSLTVRIRGLSLLQRSGRSITTHLIDGTKVGMGPHEARLQVPAALIDASSTVTHTADPNDSTMRLVDLTNQAVTIPGFGSGTPNADPDESAIGSSIPAPNGWGSIRLTAYLSTLCGADAITDTTKFYGSVKIDRGRLTCNKPDSPIGASTVWTFTDPATGNVVVSQAMSDVVVCQARITQSGPTFTIGTRTLVLVPGQSGTVTVRNMPPQGTMGACGGGQAVCADHLNAYYDLVNHKFKPVAQGAGPAPPPGADPNYCPPGFI